MLQESEDEDALKVPVWTVTDVKGLFVDAATSGVLIDYVIERYFFVGKEPLPYAVVRHKSSCVRRACKMDLASRNPVFVLFDIGCRD